MHYFCKVDAFETKLQIIDTVEETTSNSDEITFKSVFLNWIKSKSEYSSDIRLNSSFIHLIKDSIYISIYKTHPHMAYHEF